MFVEGTFACSRLEHPFFATVGMTEIESAAALELAHDLKKNLHEWRDKRFAAVDQEVRFLSDKAPGLVKTIPDFENEAEFMKVLRKKPTNASELAQLHVKMEDAIQTALTAREKVHMPEGEDELLKHVRKMQHTVFGAVLKNAWLAVLRNSSLKASCKEGEELRSHLDEVVKEFKNREQYEELPATIKSDVEDVMQFSLQLIGKPPGKQKRKQEDACTPLPKADKEPSGASVQPTPPKRGGGRGAGASQGRPAAVGRSSARGRGNKAR